jgi:hypothetical protein
MAMQIQRKNKCFKHPGTPRRRRKKQEKLLLRRGHLSPSRTPNQHTAIYPRLKPRTTLANNSIWIGRGLFSFLPNILSARSRNYRYSPGSYKLPCQTKIPSRFAVILIFSCFFWHRISVAGCNRWMLIFSTLSQQAYSRRLRTSWWTYHLWTGQKAPWSERFRSQLLHSTNLREVFVGLEFCRLILTNS